MTCELFVPKQGNINEKMDHFGHLTQTHQMVSNIYECEGCVIRLVTLDALQCTENVVS